MFIDFINQTIYGEKGMYLSHFSIDKEVAKHNKYVAFKMYININEYHNKLGYDVDTIQEEYPILDEIVKYVTNYYSSFDNHNEDMQLGYDPHIPSYHYDKIKGCWTVYFYRETSIEERQRRELK